MSFGQYTRFLIVGAFVGVVTIGCRELIGHLLVVDNRQTYSISIVIASAIGIVLSFVLNAVFLRKDAAHPLGLLNRDGYGQFGNSFASSQIALCISNGSSPASTILPAQRWKKRKSW